MAHQAKYKAYEASPFFADGASARPIPAGTVPRDPLNSTVEAPDFAQQPSIPFPITRDVLHRGQDRFNIYCSVCHGRLGNGEGMIVQRGFLKPPSFHIERLMNESDSHFYNVITNGYGAMFSYPERVAPQDRWMIVAYIRALQAAPQVAAAGLSDADRKALYGTGQGVHQP